MTQRILLVDSEPVTRQLVERLLGREGYSVVTAATCAEAVAAGKPGGFDVVLSNIELPDGDGFAVLRAFRELDANTQVVLITGFGSVEAAVKAVKAGAFDIVAKPFKIEEIKLVVRRACEHVRLLRQGPASPQQAQAQYGISGLVGRSPAMTAVYKTIAKVLDTKSTVLVQGESGTGKELVARAIHFNSQRSANPFLAINCAALPESLLESELFGHKRGSFTGALYDKRGLFEEATGGTLFLDEIGDTTPGLQSKLLRVLEEQQVRRVGDHEAVPINVRIIAATNKDLQNAVKTGGFREDLYYRLNVITIRLAPLRERLEDIPLLVERYLALFNRDYKKYVAGVSPEAMRLLTQYSYPGNVRELVHALERAIAMSTRQVILPEDLPAEIQRSPIQPLLSLEELERGHIQRVLLVCHGNRQQASEILGIDRKTLYRKALRYGIRP